MKEFDVIVVGAGVVGSSFATYLGRKGYDVLCLDRQQKEEAKFSGELLQPGGVLALEKLGLSDVLDGIDAQPIKGFAVFDQSESRCLDYPSKPKIRGHLAGEDSDSIYGYSFHHHLFLHNLRKHLASVPSVSFVVGQAKELLFEGERVVGISYKNETKELCSVRAKLVVQASGRNTQLNQMPSGSKFPSTRKGQKISYSVGIYLKGVTLPHPGYGHVLLTKPAPSLMYQLDKDTSRVLLDIPGRLPPTRNGELQAFLKSEILPQFPASLQQPFLEALEEANPQSIQIIQHSPSYRHPLGMVRVGDSLSTRHPLTGGGMTVALNDAYELAEHIQNIDWLQEDERDRAIKLFYRKRETMALTIDLLSGALYEIFKADSPETQMMRDAVMDYWSRGGRAVSGPMQLLAGIQPDLVKLLGHYVALSYLGFARQLSGKGSASQKLLSYQGFKAGTTLLKGSFQTLYGQARNRVEIFLMY